jgi:uncharacterized protein with HEPN domain
MHPSSPSLLRDVLERCDAILVRVAAATLAEYERDLWFRSGVERHFEVIGEALRRIERRDPALTASIPDYRNIVDFRNLIAHGYDTIDHPSAWHFVTWELPSFRARIAEMLVEAKGGSREEAR